MLLTTLTAPSDESPHTQQSLVPHQRLTLLYIRSSVSSLNMECIPYTSLSTLPCTCSYVNLHTHLYAFMQPYVCAVSDTSLNFNKYLLSSGSPFHCASWCCLPSLPSLCTSSLRPFLTSPPCLCYVCNPPSFNTCIPTACRNVYTM